MVNKSTLIKYLHLTIICTLFSPINVYNCARHMYIPEAFLLILCKLSWAVLLGIPKRRPFLTQVAVG